LLPCTDGIAVVADTSDCLNQTPLYPLGGRLMPPIGAFVIGVCAANVFANRPTVRPIYSANDVAEVSVLSPMFRQVVVFFMYVMEEAC
jgi:hypothetical protein